MFEAHVVYILRRYLGQYVHGLSPEALQISVWKGDIVLKDLQLKAEALNALKLPITVKAGFLGSVTFKVPWNRLGTEPVIALIDRVFVLAEPVEDELLFSADSKEGWVDAKRSQIEEMEMAMLGKDAGTTSTSPESKSWMVSFFATIIGNIKISVTNLHIRYEDTLSNPLHPFCFGITLAKLAAVTIDEKGVETFVTSGALDRLNKSLQLEKFSVYHDADTKPWKIEKRWDQLTAKEWSELFEPSIKAKVDHQYLLDPFGGAMKYYRLGKRDKREPEIPFQRASLVLDLVSFNLSEAQYLDGLKVLEGISRYRTRMEFSRYRPLVPVLEDPKAWWRYAYQAVLLQQNKSRCKFSWENISERCDWRRKYVKLYANSLQQGKADSKDIRDIDKELDTEVALLWRLLAHAKVETARLEAAASAREKAKRGSWWSFGWGNAGSKDAGTSPGWENPGELTKEEWNKINELVSYQPGQDFSLLSRKEAPNMLQTAFEVTLTESVARVKNSSNLEILRGTFSTLNVGLKMYPKMLSCNSKLASYGLSAPEGELIESVSREGRLHALELKYVYAPLEEQLDWKLAVAMSPCHVTVWRSSLDRFLQFLKSGQALSPSVALETAAVFQSKLEEVTRRAQEHLQTQLLEQRRFSVDLDIDAPKVKIPVLHGQQTQLLVDLGHFSLRTVEDKEAKPDTYSKFYISARDISALFVDGAVEWSTSDSFSTSSTLPILDRCGMSIMFHQARLDSPTLPSSCMAIDVPRLGLHFSPARYQRLLHLMNALEGVDQQKSNLQSSWKPEDYSGDARVIFWGGIGNIRAKWEACWLALTGSYLYILDDQKSASYRRCCSMNGKQVLEIPPSLVGGSEHVIAVCGRGLDAKMAIESSTAVVIQLKSVESKANWMKCLTFATYRSSAPVSLLLENDESTLRAEHPSKHFSLFVSGVLKELQISVSGKIGSSEEVVIAELQALGGEVNLLQRPFDMKIATKLHSLKVEDKLQGSVSPSCRYVARSVLSAPTAGEDETVEDEKEDFRDALPEFTSSFSDGSQKHDPSYEPGRINFLQMWALMDQVFEKNDGAEASDFVRVMLILRQPQSDEYAETDIEMTMSMATLDFFCNRPTLVAFIDFGVQLGGILEAEAPPPAVSLDDTAEEEQEDVVKGLLGRGKSRVVFRLKLDMESARIFLNLEDGSQLAMLAQDKFQMDLKVYPGSFTVNGNLGNLRVCDMKLGPGHQWGWLCDIRDPTCGSLVTLEFQSFGRDEDDFKGYDYSLSGRMSAVRIVFLYRFVQEVSCYFTALASPQVHQVITVVDTTAGIERLIQNTDIEGAPALKLDLTMDTPIIVMPRDSHSREFMQLDLGHLQLSNSFEWHGGGRPDASAVHLDVLVAEITGISMVVGIDGKAGKSMIQEAEGLQVIVRRPLRDIFRKVPEVQVDVQVQTLCGKMSDREYLVILDCAAANVSESPDLPANFRESSSSESDEQESSGFKSVQLEEQQDSIQHDSVQEYYTKVWVIVDVQYAGLELFKGVERESSLARVEIHGLWLGYRSASTLEADVYVTLPKLSVVDLRPGTNSEMRLMFGSMADVEQSESKAEDAKSVARLTMLVMDLRIKPDAQTLVMRMQRPRLLVVVDFLLEVTQFFVPSVASSVEAAKDPIATANHIRLCSSVHQQQVEDIILSTDCQLIADACDVDEFIYDGCDRAISLKLGDDYSGEPVIVIGFGKKLRFKNVRIKNGSRIHECVQLAAGASYSVLSADGVVLEQMDDAVMVVAGEDNIAPSSPRIADRPESNQDFLLDIQIVAPELTFYDSTKWPSSNHLRQERLLRAKLDFNLMLSVKGEANWIRAYVKGLTLENSSGALVVDPIDISAEYARAQGKSNIMVTATDVFMRPSFSVARLVMRLHDDAVEKFKFGSNVLFRCTHFDRIWVNKSGSALPEITFWRPRAPPGAVILGDCATSGMTPPSQGVVAVSNVHQRVQKPESFELVWSSGAATEAEDEACCVWLPVAPPGYVAVGCVAERGTVPPPLDTAYCIRSDLVTSSAVADCIFYIPPGDRDHVNGCSIWRVDNTTGSFFARPSTEPPPKQALVELRQLLLADLSNVGNEKADDDAEEVKILRPPGRTKTLQAHTPTKTGRNSLTTPQFERVWWDKGNETRRVVSIWRPVPAAGYSIVGDTIVDGLEPPSIGLVLRDDGSGRLSRPIRFQQRVHICGRGLEDVYIWYPDPPAGYVAMGYVATTRPDPPSLDVIRCVRMDLVGQGNLSKRPVWSYIGSRGGNSCCLWRVENQASTFIARADLKRPPARIAYYLAETGKPKVRDTLTAEMKLGRLSMTVVHDLTGLETPLINATMTGINLAAHGRPDTLNAVALMSVAASTFNAGRDAWEPLIEPFDGILKYEYYDGDLEATMKFGRRVRISAASTVNINVTTAGLQALLGAGAAWQNQTQSEQQALTSMRLEGRDYKRQSRVGTAALEEDDTEKLTIHNSLFCQLYVRTYESDFQNVEVLPEGASRVISLPPPRFPEKIASTLETQPRQFVAVHVLEAKGLPVNDDGNCPDFLCALRLVTTRQSTEEQKAHPQSARSRCIRPSSLDASRASASWNEVFIFEIPIQGSANLEVVVTNQAARSGKGEAVGILAFPVKEESSQKVSQPSSLWKMVRLSINKESSPLAPAKVLRLRPPRRKGNGNQLYDCGEISVQLSYFSTGDLSQGKEEKSNAGDFGLLFSQAPDGPWESLKSVLPVTSIPAALAGQPIIVEVSLDQGRKHATFRGLVLVANNTDMPLEVAICPFSLLHTKDSSEDSSFSEDAIKVVEECFENQRYQPLAGWGSKWPGHLIPSDPGRWSNRDFSESSQEMLRISLPPGWIWASDWFVDKSQNVDQDGWYYGPDFHSLRLLPTSSRAARKSTFDFARRRRWVRIRQRIPHTNKSHRREVVGVVEPGSLLNLPLAAMAPETDYCAQVRPVEGRYLWGQMVDSNISSTPQSGGSQRRSLRQSKSSVSSSFTLSQLEKHEQLLLCVAADTATSKGHCWFSMEAFEHSQDGDWKLSVDAPLRLENLLPCNAEYIIWEKTNDPRPVKRQHGVAPAGECVHIYAADVRRQIFLTWLPQGGWRPEKEGVLIFDPRSEELPLGFWMRHQQNNRRLRVSLEYDFGSSNIAAKVVRLFVPYWLTNDAGLPLTYRLVEVEPSSDISSGPRSSRIARSSSSVANEKQRIHRVLRMFDAVEKQAGPIMLSPHAEPERLGPVSASTRVEDVLSPRIGLSVAIAGHSTFGYGFSFRELEDNKDHVHLRAYDSNGGYYKLSVQLDLSSERTKIVRLQPHSIFLNRLGQRLQMRQRDVQEPEFLYPNQELKTFQWRSGNQPEQLTICLEGYRWSLPFGVDVVGTMHVNLVSEAGSHLLRVRVEVRSSARHSSQLVIFRYASVRGPYRIENKSSVAMCYRQYGRDDDSWQLLEPGTSVCFAWESLRRPLLLELLVAGANARTSEKYDIDEAQTYQPLSVPGGAVSAVQVTTSRDASAQLVSISDCVHRGDDSSALVPYAPASARPTDRPHRVDAPESQFHTFIELAELGVSIVDDTPEELLYLSVQNFCISYSTGLGSQTSRFKLKFDGLQVDNQLPLTPMPVLFSPQEAAKEVEFLFKCTVTMKDNGLSDKQVYPYIGIQGPDVPNVSFLVNIHEPIIWRIHQMIDSLMKGQSTSSDMDAVPVDPIISIGLLNTSEIRFKVTLAMAPTQRPRGVLGFWSTLLTSLGNTDDMPVRITAHVREDICMSRSALMAAAIESVRNDMLSQPLRLLSGVDLLGNASSALGHMSKGVAALSMDKKFIRNRQKQETKTTVEDIGDGIREGGGALAKGFFRGVTGIVTKPFEGAKSSGVEGFIQGVGKGVIGAAVQPVSGILDLLSKTTEGANATRMKLAAVLTSEEQLLRRRLPRVIGGDKIIRPYDEYKAQGQILLQLAQRGTLFGPVDIFKSRGKFASDAYEDHFNLPKARTLIVTHRRVVLLQHPTGLIVQKKPDLLKNPCTISWDVSWQELGAMELAHGKQESRTLPPSRLVIYLKATSQDTSMFDTRDSFRVVKCHPGTNQAAEIMNSIERAQEAYGPQQSPEARKTRAGIRPYAGTTARSGAAIGLLTGPSAPVSVPALATFGSLLGTAHQSVLGAEAYNERTASSSSTSSSSSAAGGRYISSFTLIWSNKGDSGKPMSIWRPVCPSGHACIGDVIHESEKEPEGVMVFQQQSRSMFALPLAFELVWREDGGEPLTIWRPVPPEGYIALGCVAVADFYEPEPDSNVVWCVNKDHIAPAPLVEPPLRRGEASIWRAGNEARTFLVQKGNQPPPEDACFTVVG